LSARIRGQPMAIGPFLDLAVEMTEIVAALHRSGVIHNDLCPANFVLGRTTTLVDFEAASAASAATCPRVEHASGSAEQAGSLPYLAPERTGRIGRAVDHRADLYALGATFYEMLTGAPPFVSSDPVAIVHGHVARPPTPPAIVRAAVPATLSDIVLRLLAKMPEHRYQCAEALLEDLREARRHWQATRSIPRLDLGRRDVPHGLSMNGRLYGRERESYALEQCLQRFPAGSPKVAV